MSIPHPPPPAEGAEPVAVTGYACRLPGAASASGLWNLLSEGRDGVGPVPPERWSTRYFHHADPDHPGTLAVREGGFLAQDLTRFDAAFFGIPPREAECMDPQQRLLLEVAWEALEHAGFPLERIAGREVGTYVGGFMMDHHVLTFDPANRRLVHRHTATGTPLCMLSNRLAHALDLRGPSLTVDTACSSSLVALHTAAVALSRGECEAALVGGVNVMTRPDASIALTKGRFLSPGARCRAFDARADGYVRAEGAGVLVLRRLRDARADGDTIHAVLLGTGVNQDGRTPGLSHPSSAAQAALLRRVSRQAGVAPVELAYAEAHGTGTRAGDRAEALALGEVYGAGRGADDPLPIGTVKAHVGHLEAAAGVAGVIRALLTLRHRRIPAALHFRTPSPDIPFDALRLRVADRPLTLPSRAGRTIVSVSSFGYGGTNAHVLLSSADLTPPDGAGAVGAVRSDAAASPPIRRGPLLLPVSARSETALRARAGDWGRRLARGKVNAADLCFTAARRLSHLEHRLAVVGRSRRELAGALRAFAEGGPTPAGTHHLEPGPARDGTLAFVFTGMGTQTGAMGRELARRFPAFRRGAREADAAFRAHAGWSVLAATRRMGPDPLRTPRLAQPLNFVFQAGLVALWRWLGVRPDAVVGHSVGEITAAWCAGALTLDQAAALVFHRSRLQETLAGRGAMLAAALPPDEATRWAEAFPGEVSVAALNGARSVTLAGTRPALEEVAAALERARVFHRFLPVDVAYHGPSMDEIRDELLVTAPTGVSCSIPLYSTVTGGAVSGAELDPEYWWRNARAPVRFADAATAMVAAGCRTFVEIGPHPVLAAGLREALMARRVNGHAVASQRWGEGEAAAFLRAAGHLHAAGRPVDWRALYPSGRAVELPAYPWQRERHWLESEASRQDRQRAGEHPLLGRRQAAPGAVFRATWSVDALGSLAEHRVRGRVVLPAAAYVEAILALARASGRSDGITVRGLTFEQPLVVPADSDVEVRFALDEAGAVSIHSTNPDEATTWRRHGRGHLELAGDGPGPAGDDAPAARCSRVLDPAALHARLGAAGLELGPAFQRLRRVWHGPGRARFQVSSPPSGEGGYHVHPAALDACFQAALAAAWDHPALVPGALLLPAGVERIRCPAVHTEIASGEVEVVEAGPDGLTVNVRARDAAGALSLTMTGLRFRPVPGDAATEGVAACLYEETWVRATPRVRAEGLVSRRWAVVADDPAEGNLLAARLREAGHAASCVAPAAAGEVLERGGAFDAVLHLPAPREAPGEEDCATRAHQHCARFLAVLRGWARGAPPQGGWLVLVTRSAVRAREGDRVDPAHAALCGLARVARAEYSTLDVRTVDLPGPMNGNETAALVEHLAAGEDEECALRAGAVLASRLVAWRAPARPAAPVDMDPLSHRPPNPAAATPPTVGSGVSRDDGFEVRPDATYLVVGGLSGLGLATAAWLVRLGARHLVLAGRRGRPQGEARAAVAAMRAAGTRVRVVAADVTSAEDVRALVERASRPPLRGVVNAAAVLEDGVLAGVETKQMRRVLAPKVDGAWNLHRATLRRELDFFLLFGSLSGWLGNPGQGSYAAANTFCDGMVELRRSCGLPAAVLHPGVVGGSGMAARAPGVAAHLHRLGIQSMETGDVLRAAALAMGPGAPRLAVARVDWSRWARGSRGGTQGRRLRLVLPGGSGDAEARPDEREALRRALRAMPPEDRSNRVRAILANGIAGLMGAREANLEPHRSFSDLGMDSLAAVEIRAFLSRTFGVDVDVFALLAELDLRGLEARVEDQLGGVPGPPVEASAK